METPRKTRSDEMTAKAFILSLRYILTIRKPELLRFDCVNLLLDGKLLLFIAWQGRRISYLNISKTKYWFYKKQGVHLLKIPDNLSKLQITFGNLWSRKMITVDLVKTKVDNNTMQYLIQDLSELQSVVVDKRLKPRFEKKAKKLLGMGEATPIITVKGMPLKKTISLRKRIALNQKLFEYKLQNPPI